jgi:hypothetical protein
VKERLTGLIVPAPAGSLPRWQAQPGPALEQAARSRG